MSEQAKITDEIKREAERTIESLKSIGRDKGSSVDELKDKYLD